jgi:hypothetical protein
MDEPSTAEQAVSGIVAAGGWCAPSSVLYGLQDVGAEGVISLPEFRLLRPGTPEYDAHQAKMAAERATETALQALVHRAFRDVTAAQDAALVAAYEAALETGLDVLVEAPPYGQTMWRWDSPSAPAYRFIGLALIERSTETWRRLMGGGPAIIRETAAGPYDWDDD